MQRTFTLEGKPIPPELFRGTGDGDLAYSDNIWTSADLQASVASNLYADEIKKDGRRVTQAKTNSETVNGREQAGYEFVGTTANGLVVVISSYNGGGSGTFYTLHTLDITGENAFDAEGHTRCRIQMTSIRGIPLGDRWSGEASIVGNSIRVTTTRQGPTDRSSAARTMTIEARRP